MARSYYPLGQTLTPREVMDDAFGAKPHPLATHIVETKRLDRDGTICYELRKGSAFGKDLWVVLFARVVNGKGEPMRDETKPFMSQSAARTWINTVEKSGQSS